MRVVMFYHSLVSDWNHGNAHFLRGVVGELQRRGHRVAVYEPADGWSLTNLLREAGPPALERFSQTYPYLRSIRYDASLDVHAALAGADLAIVHEWNDPALVAKIGAVRRELPRLRLLFHDTHHRSISDSAALAAYDLSNYDGVLAYGCVIRARYLSEGWARQAWTWHEAADTRVFRPLPDEPRDGDVVWIGNWADEERGRELREFLIEPVQRLGLRASVYGVRYPASVRAELAAAGIRFGGWLPNHDVPRVFARHAVTLHIPRRPYVQALPGIPTIRPFEALACGIPLISAPWDDIEGLFRPGQDLLFAEDGEAVAVHLARLLAHPEEAAAIAASGLQRVRSRHTCAHRVDELLGIHAALMLGEPASEARV
jgi:spore maturation protein CgeB